MNIRIGSAPDSWGVWFPDDPKQTPWQRFMDEVVKAGYNWIELGPYGYLPTNPTILQTELDKRNVKVSAGFVMGSLEDHSVWPEIEAQLTGAGELLAELGAQYLVLIDGTYSDLFTGEQIEIKRLDDDNWRRLIDATHRVADMIDGLYDMKLVFHPHAETHVEYEDQVERFLSDTDPDRVSLCFDVGHHAYRDGDPVAFMRKHHARIPYLHLKSVEPTLQKKVQEEGIPFATAVAMDMFCEPSRGAVDFMAFRDLLIELDYDGFAIVEQDMYPTPFDKPLPIAKHTRAYLKEIGLGN
ncbi:MAG: sugar phosphate isomerase/epimerase [Candidatus Latescibacteria bacterium]|jgi:inosose dehydratase|nr:sugar phosphate isomerase/epimerase [Candidatus Latescibacterota bacterium]MDP7235431.1 sugar phosphate isomerase/epimerase [Candidatus Latescibacterota bacterium]